MARVGIIGAGLMGKDVALTCAVSGHDVLVHDRDSSLLGSLSGDVRALARRYRMIAGDERWADRGVVARIEVAGDPADLAGVDWVVENVVEDVATKEAVHRRLREICDPCTRIAVNTSCVPITRLAALAAHPQNVVGMHFMNPVPMIECVEVVRGHRTSDATAEQAGAFVASLGKRAVVVNDAPGFVSNRLSHLFMNEAAFLVQEGVAQPEQIDAVFTLGYGHRMGPLATADLIGLDTVVASLRVLYDELQDPKFRCCPLLRRMVAAGDLGRKSGHGFFAYGAAR